MTSAQKKVLIGTCSVIVLAGLFFAILSVIPFIQDWLAVRNHEEWSDSENAYQWLVSGQRMNRQFFIFHTGLVPSHENGQDCFVYDQALAAMAFTHHGDYGKARAIFSFFDGVRKRHHEEYGEIWGFTDVYKADGTETETRAAGPNAWMLMALNYYMFETDDDTYMDLARELAGWLISLQSIEGGIIGGYYGNGEPMVWISTEHNFDCYAALRDLGILTSDEKYLKAAKEIRKWLLEDVWREDAGRFFLGRRNPNYATDLSSWAVLSLGNFEESLEFAIEKSLNKQTYEVKDVVVEGFDFGSTYKVSPFPDKDAVWFEGTAQMVLAFREAGREEEAIYFMSEMDKCLTESSGYPHTKGLPYASNEGTPVYDSWLMQDEPLCVSSTTWYYFAKNNFNPFCAPGDLAKANTVIDTLNYEPDYHFLPVVDDFEYSDIAFRTAYPRDLMYLSKSRVELDLTDALAADGGQSMIITFSPKEGAKKATAIIRRPFLYPQDWSAFDTLNLWVYSHGTSGVSNNIAYVGIKDREGEVYNSPPIFLNRNGWTEYTFNIWNDFKRDPYDGVTYGDNLFGLSRIIEIQIALRSKHSVEKSKVCIDRIELERKADK